MMTNNEASQEHIVERGIRAQEVLTNPTVQLVVDDLIRILTDSFLMTTPEEEEKRRQIYYAYLGVKDIIGLLNQLVAAKDQVIAAVKAEEENEGN